MFTVLTISQEMQRNSGNMSLKRSYHVRGPSSKRQRKHPLVRLNTLQAQVNRNKKEMKYYDIRMVAPGFSTAEVDSLFKQTTNWQTGSLPPPFLGRGIRVHRIRLSSSFLTSNEVGNEEVPLTRRCCMWREIKAIPPSKTEPDVNVPLATRYDPEFHTPLRDYDVQKDIDKRMFIWNVNFGASGRVVEWDDSTNGVATGTITKGDIKIARPYLTADEDRFAMTIRVWYTDG